MNNILVDSKAGKTEGRRELFRLSNRGITLNLNGTAMFESYEYFTVNDNKWHFFVVMWDSTAGEFSVIIDTIRHVRLQTFSLGAVVNK